MRFPDFTGSHLWIIYMGLTTTLHGVKAFRHDGLPPVISSLFWSWECSHGNQPPAMKPGLRKPRDPPKLPSASPHRSAKRFQPPKPPHRHQKKRAENTIRSLWEAPPPSDLRLGSHREATGRSEWADVQCCSMAKPDSCSDCEVCCNPM